MSLSPLLALVLSVVPGTALGAQVPPEPVVPTTPAAPGAATQGAGETAPAADGETLKKKKLPLVETVEPLAAAAGKTADGLVQAALAFMGGQRLDAVRTFDFERRSLHWGNRRVVFTERYRTQAKMQWPPIARVTEIGFDTVKRKPRAEIEFVQNGTDAFMQTGLEVHSYPSNEAATLSRVATEMGVPLLMNLLVKAQAPMTLDGRVKIDTFEPKTFLPVQRDDKKDEGFTDYQPVVRTYLQVTAEVPESMTAQFGSRVVLYFDEADGHLARWRYYPLSRLYDRYGENEVSFDVESYVTANDAEGKPTTVKLPGRIHATLSDSAERVETIELKTLVVDRELNDELFRRP